MLLLLLSGPNLTSLAQQEQTDKYLSLAELKQTAQLLTELEKNREQLRLERTKNSIYDHIVENFKINEELYKQQIKNLETTVEEIKPSWYDHFWIGSLVTGAIVSSIYLLAR